MAQARGSASQVLLDFETTYKTDPESAAGISIPYHYPFDLKATRPLKPSTMHRGRRDAAMPFYGLKDVKGSPQVPVDRIAFGYWLRCLLGPPVTTWPVADTINNAAAVDKGGGLVGIPITGHAFVAGEPVTIAGTINYNGDEVIVSKTANEIVITATYVAEVFAGTETVRTRLRSHVFKPGTIPSFLLDVGFTNINQFFKFNGCKLAKMEIDYGGDKELIAKLELLGAKETRAGAAYDAAPTALAISRFQNRQLSFLENGGALATIKDGSMAIANELDPDSYVANGDERFDLCEGDCQPSGAFKLFFADATLYDLAVAGTERSFSVILTDGVYSLTFLFPEVLYTVESPVIVKGGVYADFKFEGYLEDAVEDAAVQVTLVNTHAAYA